MEGLAQAYQDEPGLGHRAREFLVRVIEKAEDDDIFFMAGAIAFNLVVAIVPLFLLSLGVAGFVAEARFPEASSRLVALLLSGLPAGTGDTRLAETVQAATDELIEGRAGLSIVGAAFLVWLSTRLVGTLRIVLREVFDVGQARGQVRGKLFDAQMVLVGGALVLLHVVGTAGMALIGRRGSVLLPIPTEWLDAGSRAAAAAVSFVSIWVLLLLVYRFLPARPIRWKTVLVAATFTAVAVELMKVGFGWYVTDVANYRTAYGNLTTLAVLFFYLYYTSVVFVLGGEVGQVYTMRRALHLERRRKLSGTSAR